MTPALRKYENIHIPLWLLKDTCWMMEWKTIGVIMIVPTIFVAALLAWRTRKDEEFFVNLAILCWIMANAFWMCCEFFDYLQYKDFAGIGFIAGAISISAFYYRRFKNKNLVDAVS
jgi:hypothetical protein